MRRLFGRGRSRACRSSSTNGRAGRRSLLKDSLSSGKFHQGIKLVVIEAIGLLQCLKPCSHGLQGHLAILFVHRMFSCIVTLGSGSQTAGCFFFGARGDCFIPDGLGLGLGSLHDPAGLFPGLGEDIFMGPGFDFRGLCSPSGDRDLFPDLVSMNKILVLGLAKDGTGQQAGPFTNLGHGLFPFNSHDMDTGHTFDLLDLVDDVHTDVNALFLLVRGIFHAVDHLVGHIHTRHELFHVTCHPQRLGRGDTGQDMGLFVETEITAHLHETGEFFHVVYDLGLDEVGPGGDFLSQPYRSELEGIGKWVGRAAKEETGFTALDLFTALKPFSIPHLPNHAQELDGIHIKDTLGPRMVAKFLMVPGQAEQVLQPQGRGSQQVALHTDPVPVPAGHLDDRFHSFGLGDQAGTDTGHPDNGGLAVGDIDRVHVSFQDTGLFPDHFRITVFGRPQLTGDGKLPASEHPLQITPRFHRSSSTFSVQTVPWYGL